MEPLYNSEVLKLDDKKLQLRYLLGGLNSSEKVACESNRFWSCDIRCSVTPVPHDDRLIKVQEFIENHNISNETFIKLVQSYLRGTIMSYQGEYGNLIMELDESITDYDFLHSEVDKIDNDLGEKELLSLIEEAKFKDDSSLNIFLKKYSLTPIDFMVLAKTSLNYSYCIVHGMEDKDLALDLIELLNNYNLYLSYKDVLSYRDNLEKGIISDSQGNRKSLVKRLRDKFINS